MRNQATQQEKEALDILKKLVKKSKNLLPGTSLELWISPAKHSYMREVLWEALVLDSDGLLLESAILHRCYFCSSPSHKDTWNNHPRRLEPSVAIIQKYGLTVADLKKYLQKLE